jgi:hypothetical protein
MGDDSQVEEARLQLANLISFLSSLSDEQVGALFDAEVAQQLVRAIFDPTNIQRSQKVGDFLLANKNKATGLATLGSMAARAFWYRDEETGTSAYLSPHVSQWVEDGMLLLEGPYPFEGQLELWRNGELSFGVAAHDIAMGEAATPDSFHFISRQEYEERIEATRTAMVESSTAGDTQDLDRPIVELEEKLRARENDEAVYQKLFEDYPWMLAGQHSKVESHRQLDDENIPDFTAVRVKDERRDILELKPPFKDIFLKKKRGKLEFSADFLRDYDQAERYLRFARNQHSYLAQEKGLHFSNPRCFLITGYGLSDEELRELRAKEGMNPAIEILTYEEVLTWARHWVDSVRTHQFGTRADDPAAK